MSDVRADFDVLQAAASDIVTAAGELPELSARDCSALGSDEAAQALELATLEQTTRAATASELLRLVGQRPAVAAAALSALDRRVAAV